MLLAFPQFSFTRGLMLAGTEPALWVTTPSESESNQCFRVRASGFVQFITRAAGLLAEERRIFILMWSPDGPWDIVGSRKHW